jgi:hypothetical protein
VRELEQVVDATVKAASEQVDGLTKALSDSALAAVGVIVASFLAAIFKERFDPLVYRLGVTAYAVYVVVFPGLLGVTASAQRFRALTQSFDERLQSFSHRLAPDQLQQVVGNGLTRATRRYWAWLVVAVVVYLALGGLLWWSRTAVPRRMAAHQASEAGAAAARSSGAGNAGARP